MIRKYWTKEEEQYIKDNLANFSVKELANYFNVDYNKMEDKIHKMGLNSKKARSIMWNEKEDSLLAKHFEYAPKNYLMKLFPTRTWSSIFQRGNKTLHLNRLSQDKYYVDYNFFSEWNEYSAYYVGFFLADGHLSYKNTKRNAVYLQCELADKDIDILDKFKKLTHFEGKINEFKKERYVDIVGRKYHCTRSVEIQINNAKIVEDLIKKGIKPECKTYDATFNKDVPHEYMKDYVRGLIDGDGWVASPQAKIFGLGITGTYDICLNVKNFINPSSKSNPHQSSENCWAYSVSGKKAYDIASMLYENSNIYLDRKYNNFMNAKQKYFTK